MIEIERKRTKINKIDEFMVNMTKNRYNICLFCH